MKSKKAALILKINDEKIALQEKAEKESEQRKQQLIAATLQTLGSSITIITILKLTK